MVNGYCWDSKFWSEYNNKLYDGVHWNNPIIHHPSQTLQNKPNTSQKSSLNFSLYPISHSATSLTKISKTYPNPQALPLIAFCPPQSSKSIKPQLKNLQTFHINSILNIPQSLPLPTQSKFSQLIPFNPWLLPILQT